MTKANPGGNLAPESVYGRDALIEVIWERLQEQSIVINAERRIGKTQVLRKMVHESRAGWKPVYKDLEKVHSAEEFAIQVYDDVQEYLGNTVRAKNFLRRLLEESETEYVNLKERGWKALLASAIDDLMNAGLEQQLVFFWDEVPYMLDNILKTEGPQIAAQVLDAVRSIRMEHSRFRVVFTGSIGLHHVLAKLTDAGITSSATNDMFKLTVTPLSQNDAERLAHDLLIGEGIPCDSVEQTAAIIAREVDYIPFYIHHVVAGLRVEQLAGTDNIVKDYIARQLVDAADPWELAHYRNRLKNYYPENNDADIVSCILDVLATTETAQQSKSVKELIDALAVEGFPDLQRNELLRLLRLAEADHYLHRDTDGRYRFRFPLIRRWWKLDRGR